MNDAIPSPGILHAAAALIQLLDHVPGDRATLSADLPRMRHADGNAVLSLTTACHWITPSQAGVAPTERGRQLAKLVGEPRLRAMLHDHIILQKPAWAKLIRRGRTEAARFAPDGVAQSLAEAGLLNESPNEEVVAWWDELCFWSSRDETGDLETGRRGERLSVQYESRRVSAKPVWISIDSNLVGYDIESRRAKNDATRLRIEVKASVSPLVAAVAYFSRSEWDVALSPGYHCFHFWLLSEKPELAVIRVPDLAAHIPRNVGGGAWEQCGIPFQCFIGQFNRVLANRVRES